MVGGPKWTKVDLVWPKWTILVHFGLANAKIRFGTSHRILQGAPQRGRQLYFTFPSLERQRFLEVLRDFSEVFRDFLEVFRGPLRDPSQRQISSQRLSVLLPLIVLPLELSPTSAPDPLFKALKAALLTLRVATPSSSTASKMGPAHFPTVLRPLPNLECRKWGFKRRGLKQI